MTDTGNNRAWKAYDLSILPPRPESVEPQAMDQTLVPVEEAAGVRVLDGPVPGQRYQWRQGALVRAKRFLLSYARETRRTKAVTAAAHKLARIIFHLVTNRQEFDDSRFAADQLRYLRPQKNKLRAKAHALGFQLIPLENAR